jgi:hypothetical protein
MMMNTDCYIEIPADKLKEALQAAYAMSSPQGLGYLHYKDGGLSDSEAAAIIDRERPDGNIAASMDYVNGRSCKFHVYREGGKLLIAPSWYDHSDYALVGLLAALGVDDPRSKIDAAQAAQDAENERWKQERASAQ